jgi:hypothetical protein
MLPFFGLELLGMAPGVAAFNLPARVGQLFGVSTCSGVPAQSRTLPSSRKRIGTRS